MKIYYTIYSSYKKSIINRLNNKKRKNNNNINEENNLITLFSIIDNTNLDCKLIHNNYNIKLVVNIKSGIDTFNKINYILKTIHNDNYLLMDYYKTLVKLVIYSFCNCDKKDIKNYFYNKNIYSVFVKSKTEYLKNLNRNFQILNILINNISNSIINCKQKQNLIKQIFD